MKKKPELSVRVFFPGDIRKPNPELVQEFEYFRRALAHLFCEQDWLVASIVHVQFEVGYDSRSMRLVRRA